MTDEQDTLRADLRELMADPGNALSDYSADPSTVGRVGKVIGETARHEERHVRASDSGRDMSPDAQRSGPNIWLWSVSVCTSLCTAALLGVLAYSHFG
jgi:hypothetical protein